MYHKSASLRLAIVGVLIKEKNYPAQARVHRAKLYNDDGGHATIGYRHLVHYGPINGTESAKFRNSITI